MVKLFLNISITVVVLQFTLFNLTINEIMIFKDFSVKLKFFESYVYDTSIIIVLGLHKNSITKLKTAHSI